MKNPYKSFVSAYLRVVEKGRACPLGGIPPAKRPKLRANAPKALLFAPHPDDECIVGALALRLLREAKMNVINVAVTQGSIRLLTRDELQGVIGHEFSHILNGDMRLNLRLMGIIFGILCLTVIGRVLLYTRSRSSKDKNPLPLLGLALVLIGWIGVLFGRLIQSAVSRQREFRADAGSAQLLGRKQPMINALGRLGQMQAGVLPSSVSAMGITGDLGKLFATHPPLEERIAVLQAAQGQ